MASGGMTSPCPAHHKHPSLPTSHFGTFCFVNNTPNMLELSGLASINPRTQIPRFNFCPNWLPKEILLQPSSQLCFWREHQVLTDLSKAFTSSNTFLNPWSISTSS